MTLIGVPHIEHCTIVSLRLSPSGVNSASSKLCPLHLMHVETAISAFPFRAQVSICAEHTTACYRKCCAALAAKKEFDTSGKSSA
jgi:hypothetical protein